MVPISLLDTVADTRARTVPTASYITGCTAWATATTGTAMAGFFCGAVLPGSIFSEQLNSAKPAVNRAAAIRLRVRMVYFL